MDTSRFDTISRLFATRGTRRAAIGGSLGLAATSAMGKHVIAQQGTPQVATPAVAASGEEGTTLPQFLFVQPFDSGAWAPKDGDDGTYSLTLTGAAASTIYFSDRPEREVGLVPNQKFLDGLGFTPANPPNAAIVATQDGSESQDVLVIELFNPVYDASAGTLTYDARVLADYDAPGLASLAEQQTDAQLDEAFGEGSLFIDSCPDGSGTCYQIINGEKQQVGYASIGCCWKTIISGCTPCSDDESSSYYGQICASAYPDTCTYSDGSWDCYIDNTNCPIA